MTHTPRKDLYDCVILGGGPAGSTAGALLAKAGVSTLLVEREAMPRQHIGESLMPETYWIFQRLGVLENLQKSRFPQKVGVQFVNSTGRDSKPFFFRQHDDRDCSETWHVDRADFDLMLFENAQEKGAECLEQTRAIDFGFEGERMTSVQLQDSVGAERTIACRVVIDATGQQSLLANRLRLKRPNPKLKKAAIWRHFRGGDRDASGGGVKTIISHTCDKLAWFWYIPMPDDSISVGVVGDSDYLLKGRDKPEEVFDQEMQKCEGVKRRLANAQPMDDLHVDKEFSYSTARAAGEGWVLVGDAWGFIDPVYSSGVYFAMKSAEMASDCIRDALRHDDPSAERLGAWVEEFADGVQWVRKLVDAFYSGEFRVGKFAIEHPQHVASLTNLLIGRMFEPGASDLFDDLDPWLARRLAEAENRDQKRPGERNDTPRP